MQVPHRLAAATKRQWMMLPGVILAATLPLLALAEGGPQQTKPTMPTKPAQATNTDRGQLVFEQNCSRCHNAPEGFSPRITGTIAMHMRVRANLSDENYRALRRFLNP
jgi:cytochrome c5